MKRKAITVRLDDDLKSMLDRICHRSGRTRSEVVHDGLRCHLAPASFFVTAPDEDL